MWKKIYKQERKENLKLAWWCVTVRIFSFLAYCLSFIFSLSHFSPPSFLSSVSLFYGLIPLKCFVLSTCVLVSQWLTLFCVFQVLCCSKWMVHWLFIGIIEFCLFGVTFFFFSIFLVYYWSLVISCFGSAMLPGITRN